MERPKANPKSVAGRAVLAIVLPFVILSAYLVLSRWPSRWFTTASDYAAAGVSLLAGSVLIATLPMRRELRVILLVFYIPVLCLLLFFYALQFVGMVFGDWL